MRIIDTNPVLQLYCYFTIWLSLPDPYEGAKETDYIDVYMLCHDTTNENKLLQQLNEVLDNDTE